MLRGASSERGYCHAWMLCELAGGPCSGRHLPSCASQLLTLLSQLLIAATCHCHKLGQPQHVERVEQRKHSHTCKQGAPSKAEIAVENDLAARVRTRSRQLRPMRSCCFRACHAAPRCALVLSPGLTCPRPPWLLLLAQHDAEHPQEVAAADHHPA